LRQHSSFNRNLHLQIICVLTGNLKVIRCSRHYQCGGARNTLYCTFFFSNTVPADTEVLVECLYQDYIWSGLFWSYGRNQNL